MIDRDRDDDARRNPNGNKTQPISYLYRVLEGYSLFMTMRDTTMKTWPPDARLVSPRGNTPLFYSTRLHPHGVEPAGLLRTLIAQLK